jgi:hypothetical protein
MRNVSRRDIIIVSLFILCTIAVIWQRWQVNKQNPGQQQAVRDSLYQQKRQFVYNSRVYSKAVRLAKTGDIVVRLGNDMTSEMMRSMNLTDPSYSHAGIISREGDTVFVYHALGGELNPNEQIRKEPLWQFGRPNGSKALGIYRVQMDSATYQRLMEAVHSFYQRHMPFDNSFDLRTKDRLYCTEFVSCCFEQAFKDTGFFQRSTAGGKTYIAPDNLTGNKRALKVAAWKY